MFSLSSSNQYYLYDKPCDMRKSFDSLSGVVESQMSHNPCDGSVYVFINKRRDRIKLLHWEYGGFVLYYKRLEKGVLESPRLAEGTCLISWSTLMLIIEGIRVGSIQKSSRFSLKKTD